MALASSLGLEALGTTTPMMSTYTPIVFNPPSSMDEFSASGGTVSDPLGLGNITNGGNIMDDGYYMVNWMKNTVNLDEEYLTEEDQRNEKDMEVDLQVFFMLGGPNCLVEYDETLESMEEDESHDLCTDCLSGKHSSKNIVTNYSEGNKDDL